MGGVRSMHKGTEFVEKPKENTRLDRSRCKMYRPGRDEFRIHGVMPPSLSHYPYGVLLG